MGQPGKQREKEIGADKEGGQNHRREQRRDDLTVPDGKAFGCGSDADGGI